MGLTWIRACGIEEVARGGAGGIKREAGDVVHAPAKTGGLPEREDRSWRRTFWAQSVVLAAAGRLLGAEVEESKLPPPTSAQIDFTRDIKPILANNCYKCHSGEKPKSHFLLSNREAALKGGGHGLDILPGQSAKSPLIHYVSRLVEDMEMPPEGKGTPLTLEQIGLLRAWIDQGAVWEQTAPEATRQVTASPTAGYTSVSGDAGKFRELNWQPEGWNGGLAEFDLAVRPDPSSKLTVAGHVLRDDYNLSLAAEKNDLGFTRFGWSQYRKYYDDLGGYYAPFIPPAFELGRDLHTDIGRAWADFGLTLPRWPSLVLGYEYQYRDGTESMLQWGPVSNGHETRNIYPAFENLSEKVHLLKFDFDYEGATWLATDSFRGEWYELATRQQNDSFDSLGATELASALVKETNRHFQGMNTLHVEKQFKDWLFASGGYLYSQYNGDASLNMGVENPALLSPALPAPVWQSPDITLERESHVFSVSALLGPWQGLSLSLGTQNEWTRQSDLGHAATDLALPFKPFFFPVPLATNQSSLDCSTFSQDASLRFTLIPYTTLFAEARLQQQSIGGYEQETGGLTPFLLNTEETSNLSDVRAGFNTSPWRRVSLSAYYRRYDDETDYDYGHKTYPGYPGFIRWRDLLSEEAQAKLSFQAAAWLKTSLTYQWLDNTYHTATDPVDNPLPRVPGGISPGASLLAGQYHANTVSLNATMTPWRRVFLSTTFTWQQARTVTFANDSPSVVPYQGDIYSVILSGTYVLDHKTDLTASYSFSHAGFAQDNVAAGLPLGVDYMLQTGAIAIKRQLTRSLAGSLRYAFSYYSDPSAGGLDNYTAHGVFATLTFDWR